MQACFEFNFLIVFKLTNWHTTFQSIFRLSLGNKSSKVKTLSVLNYTKINPYTIILIQVVWNSANLVNPMSKETFIRRCPKHIFFAWYYGICLDLHRKLILAKPQPPQGGGVGGP